MSNTITHQDKYQRKYDISSAVVLDSSEQNVLEEQTLRISTAGLDDATVINIDAKMRTQTTFTTIHTIQGNVNILMDISTWDNIQLEVTSYTAGVGTLEVSGFIKPRFEEDEILYGKTEVISPSLTYRGFNKTQEEPTDNPTWRVTRENVVATETTSIAADSGYYTQVWDDRGSLFPAAPFNNSLATDFDGIDDFVEVTHSTDFAFERTDSFSVSFWIKTASPGTSMAIFSKEDSTSSFRGWGVQLRSGKVRFLLRNTSGSNELIMESSFSVGTSIYQHYCITYDGTSGPSGVNMYRDGIVDASLTTISNSLSATSVSTSDMRIGSRDDGVFFYSGLMDEVSIWDSEFDSTEVLEIRNAGVPADNNEHSQAVNLIAWLQMGDADTFPVIGDKSTAGGFSTHDADMLNMASDDFSTDAA